MAKSENKMIYGMQMNLHQIDRHTIQMYILDVNEGDRPHAPVTVEHPDKHPNRVKANGEPYAREHESLFNILKMQLIKEGKWKEPQKAYMFGATVDGQYGTVIVSATDQDKAEYMAQSQLGTLAVSLIQGVDAQ